MNKTRNPVAIVAAVIISLSFTSCQKAANGNAAAIQPANTAASANQLATAPPPVSTDTSTAATPTDAYKAAYAARKSKDVTALKKLMSKDIMEFFTEISGLGEKKQTIDELLMELCEKPQAPTAEARNEKIDGDHATIEYLDEKGDWSTMDFVKEGGGWKLTIPKMDGAPPKGQKEGKKE